MWSDVFNFKKQTTPYTSQASSNSEQLSTLGRRHRPDYWLIALCVILLLIGLVVIYSISPAMSEIYHVGNNYYVFKQLIAIVLGLLAFVVAAKIPLNWWYKFVTPVLIIATLATLLAIVMPVNPSYPAHRWVRLGNFSFESVELVKFALLVWLAKMLTIRIQTGTIKNIRLTLRPLLIALAIIGVVVAGIQSDLGSVGVIVVIVGAMLFVAGLPLKKLAIIVAVIIAGLILLTAAIPYRRERLLTYLHPTANCQGSGYQACQAIIGVGSGGMVGLGLGSSVQAYGYLPEAVNDSIFAIYAEKFGFIGVTILMAIFVALFSRLKNIAERAPDDFSRLLVVGVLSWLCVQTLINVGAMIGLLPLKGITLPFISYGGTSIVFVLAALGLVFQVSAYTTYTSIGQRNRGAGHDYSSDGRRVRGSYHPYIGSSSRA
jgi:cell division protein FtsW